MKSLFLISIFLSFGLAAQDGAQDEKPEDPSVMCASIKLPKKEGTERYDRAYAKRDKCEKQVESVRKFLGDDANFDVDPEGFEAELKAMEELHKAKITAANIECVRGQSTFPPPPKDMDLDCMDAYYGGKANFRSFIPQADKLPLGVGDDLYRQKLCGAVDSGTGMPGERITPNYELMASASVRMIGLCVAKLKMLKHIETDQMLGEFELIEPVPGMWNVQCQRLSPYTMDYKHCKKTVASQQLFDITSQVSAQSAKFHEGMSKADAQEKYQKNMQEGDTNYEAGMKLQGETYKDRRDAAYALAGTYTASNAALTSMLTDYPSPGLLARKCKNEDPSEKKIPYCLISKYKANFPDMFANQAAKNVAWQYNAGLTSKAIAHAMQAIQLNDFFKATQSGLDDFQKAMAEAGGNGFDNCASNPALCKDPGGQTKSEFSMGGFNFGSGSGTDQLAFDPEGVGETESAGGLPPAVAEKLIDELNQPGDKLTDDFKKHAPGDLKGASPGGGGGGGGSGGLAGGGGGGAGGGSAPGEAPPEGEAGGGNSGSSQISARYTSGGSVSKLRKGQNSQKKKASVYGDLFKDQKRSIASKADDIAPQDSELFKKISLRYEKLNAKNRLKKF